MWYNKWHNSGLLIDQITNKDLYDARILKMISLADMIGEGVWKWPKEWNSNEFEVIKIMTPRINTGIIDQLKWRCDDNNLIPFHINMWWMSLAPMQKRLNGTSVGVQTSLLCPLYSKVNDSHSHLFFLCEFSKDVWKRMAAKINLNKIDFIWEEVVNELLEKNNGNNIWSTVKRISLVAVVYFIWQERNQRIFRGEKRNSNKLYDDIIDVIKLKLMNIKEKDLRAVRRVADI
ncbi:hypothetical protein Tco_0650979 [Tanacetum coccineum]